MLVTIVIYLLMAAEDWRWRHAALMAVSAVGEGCLKQMRDMLEGVVDAILPFCQDQVIHNY